MLVDEIENGIYSSRSPISRVDYTMDLINRSRGLEKYTESEIVKKLANQSKLAVKNQDIENKKSLLDLLQRTDGHHKNEKKNKIPYYFKEALL